ARYPQSVDPGRRPLRGDVKRLLALLLVLAPTQAGAEEGFSASRDALPPALRSAWDSTFFVEPADGRGDFGTAFLVAIEEAGAGRRMLTFVTAGHVVRGICGGNIGPCPGLTISDGGYDSTTRRDIAAISLRAEGADVLRLEPYPDLALVRTSVPLDPH